MILKKGLLTELEKNLKTKKKILRKTIIFGGRACFGWVGRSTANHQIFQFGPRSIHSSALRMATTQELSVLYRLTNS